MENITSSEPFKKIIRTYLGAGLSRLRGKALGGGIWGFAVPVAVFVIDDITRPDGVVVPFCKWALGRATRVRVVAVSPRSFRRHPEKSHE